MLVYLWADVSEALEITRLQKCICGEGEQDVESVLNCNTASRTKRKIRWIVVERYCRYDKNFKNKSVPLKLWII